MKADSTLGHLYSFVLRPRGLALTLFCQVALLAGLAVFGPAQREGDEALVGLVWQVHAAFASIGFAGLALAFQMLSDPPVSAGSARYSVVDDLQFSRLLFSGVTASLSIGSVALWGSNWATIAATFAVTLTPSVLLVAGAYGRLARLFTAPTRVEELSLAELERRLTRAISSAVRQETVESTFAAKVEAQRGLVSGPLPGGTTLPTRHVRFARYRGFVASVDLAALVYAADYLGWVARENKTNLVSYDYPQRISVRARPGREYKPGDVLFEMDDWPGVSDSEWTALERQLLGSVLLVPDGYRDPRAVIEDEMAALGDSALAAVRDQQLGSLKRGYKYHHQVVHEARGAGAARFGLSNPYWFEIQLMEIDVAAARSSDRAAMVAVADAQRMANTAIRTGDVTSLEIALVRLQRVWAVLVEDPPTGAVNARENLLVALQNLAEFTIPLSGLVNEAMEEACRQAVAALAAMARAALDADDVSSATRVIGYMGGLYEFADLRVGASLGTDVAVAQAAVLAWILFIRERRNSSIAVPLVAFPARHLKPDVADVLRRFEEREYEGPWRHWESSDSLPLRTRTLEFETYFRRAALLLLAAGRLGIGRSALHPQDRYVLEATANSTSDVESYWSEYGPDSGALRDAARSLNDLVEGLEAARRENVAGMPLAPEKLEEFREALIETVGSAHRLASFLKIEGSGALDDADHQKLLGEVLRGLPRDFFVNSDVLAFPSSIGHQLGARILRQQDMIIVGVLVRAGEELVAAESKVAEEMTRISASMQDPVVVYNGQSRIEQILGVEIDDESWCLGGFEAFPLYIGDDDYLRDLLVVDRSRLPDFAFVAEENEGLEILSEIRLSVGVLEDSESEDRHSLKIEYGQTISWNPTVQNSVVLLRVGPEQP